MLVASKNGLDLTQLRARQFDAATDPTEFEWLIVMDRQNETDVIELGSPPDRVRLMRSFDPTLESPLDVPDPYYGGDDGFDKVYEMLTRACEGMLTSLGY